jgi:hypothetical protein
MSQSFYIAYRTAIGYPWYQRKENAKGKRKGKVIYPTFESLEEWQNDHDNGKPSTKLQALVDICRHALSDDDREPPIFDEQTGNITYPDLPPSPTDGPRPQLSKGIVYQEFTSQLEMTVSVGISSVMWKKHWHSCSFKIFSIHGIQALAINGTMSLPERASVIERWSNPKSEYRILIISIVGSQGLNLISARFVILFVSVSSNHLIDWLWIYLCRLQDVVWSEVVKRQIVGRAWRRGQEKVVTVYNLIALGTTDVMMSGIAATKGQMLKAFTAKNPGDTWSMYGFLHFWPYSNYRLRCHDPRRPYRCIGWRSPGSFGQHFGLGFGFWRSGCGIIKKEEGGIQGSSSKEDKDVDESCSVIVKAAGTGSDRAGEA